VSCTYWNCQSLECVPNYVLWEIPIF
jgi:hypothetical protein